MRIIGEPAAKINENVTILITSKLYNLLFLTTFESMAQIQVTNFNFVDFLTFF